MSNLKNSIYTVMGAFLALTIVLLGCAPQPAEPSTETLIEQGKAAYIAGRFLDARDFFTRAQEQAPDDQEAFYGYARVLHDQHLYSEAIAAYEEALSKNSDNVEVRIQYAKALTWGGLFKGDQRWVEKGLTEARSLLWSNPSSTEIYRVLYTAIQKMQSRPGYLETLEALAKDHPDLPVVAIELYTARLQQALMAQDEEQADKVREELRVSLEHQEISSTSDTYALYYQAQGYGMLEESDKVEDVVRRLEQTDSELRLARQMKYNYQFRAADYAARTSEDKSARLQVFQQWAGRFPPTWEAGRSHSNSFDEDYFRVLRNWIKQPPESQGSSLIADPLGTLIDVGTNLARFNSSHRANYYAALCKFLIEQQERPELVVELVDEAVAALEAGEPGLFYPGDLEAEREQKRSRLHSILTRLQGQAFVALGDLEQAEFQLRAAVAMQNLTSHHTALGQFLLDQGRKAEAADQMLAAMAEGFGAGEVPGEADVRQILIGLQAEHGLLEGDLDEQIKRRKEVRDREKKAELLADRVDQPAPAFTLTDIQNQTWSLEEQKGKVVLLNFWATWCGPCISEMPLYKSLVDEYADQDDVVFLAVSMDEKLDTARDWLDEEKYSFTVVHDSGTTLDYNVTGIPATVLIDPEGKIQYRDTGFSTAEEFVETMRARIDALRKS